MTHGIPHLVGDDLEEVVRAQGRQCAQARGWQLEVARRRAEGRLAEVLGTAAVGWDSFARRAVLGRTARRSYEALEPETKALLAAYVGGINEALAEGTTAPELDALGVAPEPWAPETPVAVFQAGHVLFAQFPDKLWKAAVSRAAGPDVLALLSGTTPPDGSNALALTGERTVTGLPLVTGDPHRTFEAPNAYHQVRLSTPENDVSGFTFAGVPGVQHFAQAGQVAWAITNAMADYQDLYVESLRPDGDDMLALGPDGWARCESWIETVQVRDSEPVEVPVLVTERGPVVLDGPSRLSLRTSPYALGECGFDAIPRLLRARTVADVEAAFAHWVEPVNNLLAADTAGAVVHRVVGRVPDRPMSPVPLASDDPAGVWRGWVDLPSVDAVDGAVVTANDRVTPEWGRVGSDFAGPYRATRIRARLAEQERWSAADVHQPLLDVRQTHGASLLEIVAGLEALSDAARELQAELAGWDREMRRESATAARFVALREAVVELLLDRPALRPLREITAPEPLYAAWFDPRARVARAMPQLLATDVLVDDAASLVAAAMERAADKPVGTWGEVHRYSPLTGAAMVGAPEPVDSWVDVAGTGLDGDTDCPRSTAWIPGTDRVLKGSVARYVWDLGDPAESRWAVPLGATGHDTDQFEAWRSGELLPVDSSSGA